MQRPIYSWTIMKAFDVSVRMFEDAAHATLVFFLAICSCLSSLLPWLCDLSYHVYISGPLTKAGEVFMLCWLDGQSVFLSLPLGTLRVQFHPHSPKKVLNSGAFESLCTVNVHKQTTLPAEQTLVSFSLCPFGSLLMTYKHPYPLMLWLETYARICIKNNPDLFADFDQQRVFCWFCGWCVFIEVSMQAHTETKPLALQHLRALAGPILCTCPTGQETEVWSVGWFDLGRTKRHLHFHADRIHGFLWCFDEAFWSGDWFAIAWLWVKMMAPLCTS